MVQRLVRFQTISRPERAQTLGITGWDSGQLASGQLGPTIRMAALLLLAKLQSEILIKPWSVFCDRDAFSQKGGPEGVRVGLTLLPMLSWFLPPTKLMKCTPIRTAVAPAMISLSGFCC